MNRLVVAHELVRIAEMVTAIDFPTDDAMKKYLDEHPDADKSNHKVVKTEKKHTPKKEEKKDAPKKDEKVSISGFNDLKPATLTQEDKDRIEDGNYKEAIKVLESSSGSSIKSVRDKVKDVLSEAKGREDKIRDKVNQWADTGSIPSDLKEDYEKELAWLPHQVKGLERALSEWEKKDK